MPSLRTVLRCAIVLAVLVTAAAVSSSGDILDDWDSAKTPAKPEIKTVAVDPATTALLILDLMKSNCGQRPRCVATVPNVKRLHDAARASGMMIWYSFVGSNNQATPADMVDPELPPATENGSGRADLTSFWDRIWKKS